MLAGSPRQAGWANWSGSLRFKPSRFETPADEDEVAALVRRAAETGRTIRPVGAGHSSTPLVETDDILVSLERLHGVVRADPDRHEIVLRPGTLLDKATEMMAEVGLAPPNLGDINMQSIAGVIATGTHGTGRTLRNLSDMLLGGRLVTGKGEIVDFAVERDPELMRALRLSLGSFGIFTELRIKALPDYQLRRQEWCTHIDDCVTHWEELVEQNRHFDFYWYPRSDEAKLRILNPPGSGDTSIPWARCVEDRTDRAGRALPKHAGITNLFDEMEYALPFEAALDCFAEVRTRIKQKHRRHVGWRVLVRTTAADNLYLSPASGRDTMSISLHQNASLPFSAFFNDIEPIFRGYQGRPHWAKKHNLTAEHLEPLYPCWSDFREARRNFDPAGVFLSPYLRKLLGEPLQ